MSFGKLFFLIKRNSDLKTIQINPHHFKVKDHLLSVVEKHVVLIYKAWPVGSKVCSLWSRNYKFLSPKTTIWAIGEIIQVCRSRYIIFENNWKVNTSLNYIVNIPWIRANLQHQFYFWSKCSCVGYIKIILQNTLKVP